MTKYIDADGLAKDLEQLCDIVCQYSKEQRDVMCRSCPLGDAFELLDSQPAADVPWWIPVTEGLPEERGTYLVTVVDGTIKRAIAQWWYDVDNGEGFFSCDDCYAEDIVAWMPLPEPYKGGEEE